MAKRVFIIHGWDLSPESDWIPWLKRELEARGFEVIAPLMPNPEEPKIEEWVPYLSKMAKDVDQDTFFVGHSVGCQTILRFLEGLPDSAKIGGVVFVAGWFRLTLETDEEKRISKPWLEAPIDFMKIKSHPKKFIAIFSDNDPFVPLDENKKIFENSLAAKIIVEHNKGHFCDDPSANELPSALEAVLEISQT